MKYLAVVIGLLFSPLLWAQNQVVFQPITSDIYDFIDELANIGIVEINTAVKPWPRHWIAERLQQANDHVDELTKRQQKDLAFYLEDFGKELNEGKDWDRRLDGYYHNSEDFTLTVNPILGGNLFSNDSGSVYHRWNGAEAWAYVGQGLAFQASLRDNGVNEVLAEYNYLTPMQGGNYKLNQDGVAGGRSDWSEMKGAITYGWKWGSVGLVKDDFTWGNNYNGAMAPL